MKKTAIEYLVEEVSDILGVIETTTMQYLLLVDAINKAKELHKEQILEAFVSGDERGTGEIPFNAEQYFNQTFKK
jgi:hypothetical protein